jgi:hypothetical protein
VAVVHDFGSDQSESGHRADIVDWSKMTHHCHFACLYFGGAQDKILSVNKAAPTRDGATRAFGAP